MTKSLFLGIALALVTAACAAPSPPPPPPPPEPRGSLELRVHVIGDFHGALEPGPALGGAAFLAAHLDARREGAAHTLLVAAGDLIGGSPLPSALQHDEPSLAVLASMGLAASALGNHELDDGIDELLRLQDGGCHPDDACTTSPWPGSGFPFLAANLTRDDGTAPLAAGTIVDVGAARIGIAGAALQSTPEAVVRERTEGLVFLDEAQAIIDTAAALRADGADIVLALTHVPGGVFAGACQGPIVALAGAVAGHVELLVSGHSHAAFACEVEGLPVVATGARGEVLGEMDLTLDLDAATVTASEPALHSVGHDIAPDAAIEAMVSEAVAVSAELGSVVVGSITGDLTAVQNAAGESTLGAVVTDAQLAATEDAGAQIAFQQRGGLRAPLLFAAADGEADGEVTFAELFAVHPFGNELVTVTVTGAELEELLEQQFTSGEGVWSVSGLSYAWSASALSGQRVDPATVFVGSVALDLDADYRVTVNSFLRGVGGWTDARDPQFGPVDVDALAAWFRTQPPVAAPTEARITQTP